MIADKTPFEFLFQFLVLVQPMFWMYLYDWDHGFKEWYKWIFYFTAWVCICGIIVTRFTVGFYTSVILIENILMVCLSTYLYNQRWSIKESVCLGFLTVFLNSFYWEIILHAAELLQYGFNPGQLVQFWRLFPLVFFLRRFRFSKENQNQIVYGLVIISVFMFIRWTLFKGLSSVPIYTLTRFCALIILTKTVIESTPSHKPVDSEHSHAVV